MGSNIFHSRPLYEDEAERLCTRLPFPVTDWSFECDQCWEIPTSNQPALSFNVDPMYAMMFSLACRSLISLRSLVAAIISVGTVAWEDEEEEYS